MKDCLKFVRVSGPSFCIGHAPAPDERGIMIGANDWEQAPLVCPPL